MIFDPRVKGMGVSARGKALLKPPDEDVVEATGVLDGVYEPTCRHRFQRETIPRGTQ